MSRVPVALAAAASLALSLVMRGHSPGAERGSAEGVKVEVPGGHYTNVSPDKLRAMLARKDFLLINVHVPYEGELAGTDLLIPFDQVERRTDLLAQDRGTKILLY